MSEEIKYEPEYGLQKPFDYGPKDATAYGMFWNKILYYKIEKTSVYCFDTDNQWSHIDGAPNVPFLAMRRIIKTPVWTVADQKAGRLPEVGSKYLGKNELNPEAELICDLIDGDECVWGHDKNKKMFCFYASNIKPIETPAEKAQREEDEFIDSLKSVEIHDGTVSSFFNQGARAAYRKMKGGE